MKAKKLLVQSLPFLALFALGCHSQKASVLPKGGNDYEIVAQAPDEQTAYRNAESEAKHTCKKEKKQLIVNDSQAKYQGPDKENRDDVDAGNVALAYVTGFSGKERNSDDYRVTMMISCQ